MSGTTGESGEPILPEVLVLGAPHSIMVKWSGKEYNIEDTSCLKTILDLKERIKEMTGVHVDRQKLLNLTYRGKQAADAVLLSSLCLKSGYKIMMMGSLEKDLQNIDIPPEDRPEVKNDFDVLDDEEVEPTESREVYLAKIAQRVREYNLNVLNPSRPDKKLLVLDIDYTIFDNGTPASSGEELMRPGLHEFLTAAYEHYDIAIWSATSMKWIVEKMRVLKVSTNPNYKIAFYLDYLAMITIHTQKYGVIQVKPLAVIWGKIPQYSSKNTIMFDDLRRNFLMNPQSGLRIRPFKDCHINRANDKELSRLGKYLEQIAGMEDFTSLDHKRWEQYLRNLHRHRSRRNKDNSSSHSSSSKSS